MKFITKELAYIGVDDKDIDLFEGQYAVGHGISYNSYVIIDDKIAVMDSVDARFTEEWIKNLENTLRGKLPDYLIIQHMEPDHSASISAFIKAYPNAKIVSAARSFLMIENFYGNVCALESRITVSDGDTLSLGHHQLMFATAPMVHWPEVFVTYDSTDKVLFTADAFGKFGTTDTDEPWIDEARRYYIGIVGKYGVQVQALLKKAAQFDINMICPLHGPVLTDEIKSYFDLYDKWSSYLPEKQGVCIAYTSVYGHTKQAVMQLINLLKEKNQCEIAIHDLARCDMATAVADAFKYDKIVLATTTYNNDIFPFMRQYIEHLTERNFSNRTVALIENGSWAPNASKVMHRMLEESKNLVFTQAEVKIVSSLNDDNIAQLTLLAEELCEKQ